MWGVSCLHPSPSPLLPPMTPNPPPPTFPAWFGEGGPPRPFPSQPRGLRLGTAHDKDDPGRSCSAAHWPRARCGRRPTSSRRRAPSSSWRSGGSAWNARSARTSSKLGGLCVVPPPHPPSWDGVPSWGQATTTHPRLPRGGCRSSVPALCPLSRGCCAWCPLFNLFFPVSVCFLLFSVLTGYFLSPAPLSPSPRPGCPSPQPHRCLLVPRLEPDILLRAKQDFLKIDSAADLQ